MPTLTLKTFRDLTAHLPENTPICYHYYHKGCGLQSYSTDDFWVFPKGKPPELVVINPGEGYDGRRPPKPQGPPADENP